MVNYNNGKIYKIEPVNGEDGDIYIGSTTKELLSQRMVTHRGNYKCFLNSKGHFISSFYLFNKYGIENCKITLLELVNVNSKDELLIRESHYIKNLKCVNKHIPLRTKKEYYEQNKDKLMKCQKEYYELNKEKIIKCQKEYYELNKEKIIKCQKEYYEDNKKRLLEYHKEYYEDNKEKLLEYQKMYHKKYINEPQIDKITKLKSPGDDIN